MLPGKAKSTVARRPSPPSGGVKHARVGCASYVSSIACSPRPTSGTTNPKACSVDSRTRSSRLSSVLPGGLAHQIVNTGKTELRYLVVSTVSPLDACEYYNPNKVLVVNGERGQKLLLRGMFRAETTVDCYAREKTQRS